MALARLDLAENSLPEGVQPNQLVGVRKLYKLAVLVKRRGLTWTP
jgi:hypothetical protein